MCPDFVAIAKACGVPAIEVRERGEVASAINAALAYDGPFLINFVVAAEENVYPMVPPGKALKDMIVGPKSPALLATEAS